MIICFMSRCVVDARYLNQHLVGDAAHSQGAINEAVQQIAFSDVILLNKVDLVTAEGKQVVLETIRKINSTARNIECQLNDPNGRPALDSLLQINSFSIDRALQVGLSTG
jgi:G3E family GTPase